MNRAQVERFDLVAESLGRRPGNLRFQHEILFDRVEVYGKDVLDIGAGDGAASLYAACAGAASVVSLEPELAGSVSGSSSNFERARNAIDASNVELRAETLQDYDARGRRFDVLISVASINHLDEAACVRLQDDPDARATYLEILGKLAGLASPEATLVVCDCARRSFFGDLGVKSPLVPTIEWEKHQSPRLWAELLEEVGFRDARIRWTSSFNSLRRPGQLVLGNRAAAYFLANVFCLTAERS